MSKTLIAVVKKLNEQAIARRSGDLPSSPCSGDLWSPGLRRTGWSPVGGRRPPLQNRHHFEPRGGPREYHPS